MQYKNKRDFIELVATKLSRVDPRYMKGCDSLDEIFDMLESTLVEAGSEFYSMASRAPPCEDYSEYCAARRALLRQRLEVRPRKSEASGTTIERIDT
eukprot:9039131-Pyramimonas_sp.AAC.1